LECAVSAHLYFDGSETGVLYLNAAGTNIIVLDTYEDCVALMERRSGIYSGRIKMPMLQDLMGWDFSIILTDYGSVWRHSRRLMHNSFHSNVVKSFQPLQLKTARDILPQLGKNTDIMPLLKHNAGGTILSSTYGLNVQPKNDPFMESAEKANEALLKVPYPGAYLVDHLPILKHVPAWLPGAKFKRDANEWRKLTLDSINKPFDALKAEMARGATTPSFAYNLLQKAVNNETEDLYTDTNIRNVSASLYQG
jgi:cytochrome P450